MANIKTTDVPPNRCSLVPPLDYMLQKDKQPSSQPTGCLVAYMWPHQQHQWKPHTMQNYHHNSRFISMITRNNKKYISRYTYSQKHTLSHIHTHKHASAHATLTSCNAKAIEILWNPLLQVPRKRKPILALLLGRIAKYV